MSTPHSLPQYLQHIPVPAKHRGPFGGRLSQTLTTLSHLPTPFITTFLLIHLSAPTLANIGGSSFSSQVMLLGREYYQGTFSEPWLLFAPLGIHVTAGVAKRLTSGNPFPRRPSVLTLSAYSLLIFLPIHVYMHRFIPSDPTPPISALSPSELDYEFVKIGLAGWPVRSSVLYVGLVLCGLVHASEGWNVVLKTWCRGKSVKKKLRRILAGSSVAAVLSGLYCIASEPLLALQSTLTRVDATFLTSFIYRL